MSDFQERFFSVPLQVDIADDLVPAEVYPRNVRITLRGTNAIYLISETDIEAHLDLAAHSEPGVYKAQVQIQRRGSAAETEILEIITEPAELSLELDTRMSKSIPITANFQGYLESGFEMVSYNLDPNQMTIEGPAKLLQTLEGLQTNPIDISGRSADFSARVRIINPNQLLTLRGEGAAGFSCSIRETIFINNFDNLPISARGLAEEFEAVLDPPLGSVKIQGVDQSLGGSNGEVTLYVDCSWITRPGSYELPLWAESGNSAAAPAPADPVLDGEGVQSDEAAQDDEAAQGAEDVPAGENPPVEADAALETGGLVVERLEPEIIKVEIRQKAEN
jgi:hypothetical protein